MSSLPPSLVCPMRTTDVLRIAVFACKPQLIGNRQSNLLRPIKPQVGTHVRERTFDIFCINPPGYMSIFQFDIFGGKCLLQVLDCLSYYLLVGFVLVQLFSVGSCEVAAQDVGICWGVGFGAGKVGEVWEFALDIG